MRRIVTGACLLFLVSGAAWAAGNKAQDMKCTERLIRAEELVYGKIKAKALNEEKAEEISKLLDDADAFCTEGKYRKANATFAKVNKMVSKASGKTPDKTQE